jgi:hypothetical protein
MNRTVEKNLLSIIGTLDPHGCAAGCASCDCAGAETDKGDADAR